jgi:hypothetical protein
VADFYAEYAGEVTRHSPHARQDRWRFPAQALP